MREYSVRMTVFTKRKLETSLRVQTKNGSVNKCCAPIIGAKRLTPASYSQQFPRTTESTQQSQIFLSISRFKKEFHFAVFIRKAIWTQQTQRNALNNSNICNCNGRFFCCCCPSAIVSSSLPPLWSASGMCVPCELPPRKSTISQSAHFYNRFIPLFIAFRLFWVRYHAIKTTCVPMVKEAFRKFAVDEHPELAKIS